MGHVKKPADRFVPIPVKKAPITNLRLVKGSHELVDVDSHTATDNNFLLLGADKRGLHCAQVLEYIDGACVCVLGLEYGFTTYTLPRLHTSP